MNITVGFQPCVGFGPKLGVKRYIAELMMCDQAEGLTLTVIAGDALPSEWRARFPRVNWVQLPPCKYDPEKDINYRLDGSPVDGSFIDRRQRIIDDTNATFPPDVLILYNYLYDPGYNMRFPGYGIDYMFHSACRAKGRQNLTCVSTVYDIMEGWQSGGSQGGALRCQLLADVDAVLVEGCDRALFASSFPLYREPDVRERIFFCGYGFDRSISRHFGETPPLFGGRRGVLITSGGGELSGHLTGLALSAFEQVHAEKDPLLSEVPWAILMGAYQARHKDALAQRVASLNRRLRTSDSNCLACLGPVTEDAFYHIISRDACVVLCQGGITQFAHLEQSIRDNGGHHPHAVIVPYESVHFSSDEQKVRADATHRAGRAFAMRQSETSPQKVIAAIRHELGRSIEPIGFDLDGGSRMARMVSEIGRMRAATPERLAPGAIRARLSQLEAPDFALFDRCWAG